jgi:hypothetical protein
MNKVVHRPHGKQEPIPHAKHPGGVSQYGGAQGDHITNKSGTGYRGDAVEAGRGYKAPGMISDPVKAVGVGGGRTIHSSGSQGAHGSVNPGNPRPNPRHDALEQE